MKQILTVLALCLLFAGNVFAADRTGIYVGTSACDNKEAQQTLQLIVNPDDSMRATLSEFPAGSNSKTPVRVREFTSYRAMTYLIFMKPLDAGSSSSRRADLTLKLDPFSFTVTVMLDQCNPFQMKRDVKATEKFISRIKKEREAVMKAAEKNPSLIDLSKLTGFWMSHETRTDYRLIIENNHTMLQLLDSNTIIPLAAEKLTSDGGIVFRAEGQFAEYDRIVVAYKRGEFGPESDYLEMSSLTPPARGPKKIELKKPFNLSSRRILGKQTFVYKDWQSKKYDGYFLVKDDETQKRLKQTIDKLYEEEGWRCLAQESVLVNPNRVRTITFEEAGSNRLYLIYSPYGNSGLLFEAIPPKTYGFVNGDRYDYPIFETEHRDLFRRDTALTFSVQPSFARPYLSSQQVPVAIFVFGQSRGDYGPGCEYRAAKEVADQNFRAQVIGKIVLAFLLEYGRRVSNEAKADIPQLATTAGRNETVKSLLHDVLPDLSSDELEYVTRWVTLVMSGNFQPLSLVRETIRENILQRAIKEKPQHKLDAKSLDLLIDLVLQRKGW